MRVKLSAYIILLRNHISTKKKESNRLPFLTLCPQMLQYSLLQYKA